MNESVLISGKRQPQSIWYPDTYFILVHSQIYSADEQSVEFLPEGYVEYIRKVRLVTPCMPKILLFPFDVVNCTLQLSSFGNSMKKVKYVWDADRVEGPSAVFVDYASNKADHIGFRVLVPQHIEIECKYGPHLFSCLKGIILLERSSSVYLLQIYAPATLLVVLSWLIFWVNIESTPARASLSVTTVLTFLTLANRNAAQNEKHVNGSVTFVDIYVYICFVFVIFSMLEFSLSEYVATKQDTRRKQLSPPRSPTFIRKVFSSGESVNKAARVVMPALFALFQLCYWSIVFASLQKQPTT